MVFLMQGRVTIIRHLRSSQAALKGKKHKKKSFRGHSEKFLEALEISITDNLSIKLIRMSLHSHHVIFFLCGGHSLQACKRSIVRRNVCKASFHCINTLFVSDIAVESILLQSQTRLHNNSISSLMFILGAHYYEQRVYFHM